MSGRNAQACFSFPFVAVTLMGLISCSGLATSVHITYKELPDSKSTVRHEEMIEDAFFRDANDKESIEMPESMSRYDVELARERRMVDSGGSNITTTMPAYTTTSSSKAVPKNGTKTSDHKYYKSRFVEGIKESAYFKDLRVLYESKNSNVSMKRMALPQGSGQMIMYTVRKLKFVFPFYGHDVTRVVATSAGFLHIGPVIHSFAHDVHYVSPLMADFATTTAKPVNVYMYDDSETFVAQWDNVYEAGNNGSSPFTFQVSLFANGTIIFAYKSIPFNVVNFTSQEFPPKIGLSDGFVRIKYYRILGTSIYIPVKTIYKYHTVYLQKYIVKNNSAFILSPIQNCVQAKSCQSCFSKIVGKNFQCKWCKKLKLCSDTFDWHRQKWEDNGCGKTSVSSLDKCHLLPATKILPSTESKKGKPGMAKKEGHKSRGSKSVGIAVGLTIVIIVLIIAAVLFYGYRNPNSRLGMFMIRNRPAKFFSRF